MGCSGLGPRIPFYTPLFWGLAQKAYAWMGRRRQNPMWLGISGPRPGIR